MAGPGGARPGPAWRGTAWRGMAGEAGPGEAWQGAARHGKARFIHTTRLSMNELTTTGQGELNITAITKLKHSDLWMAAKRLGSQKALADHLNVSQQELGRWINLKAVPPQLSDIERKPTWSEESIIALEAKLMALTGKSLEQLFPDELRNNIGFLQAPKQFEHTAAVAADALETYALNARHRCIANSDPVLIAEQRDNKRHLHERLESAILKLPERDRLVIQKRYGLGDERPHNLDELACCLNVTRERVRQIETRALEHLRDNRLSSDLVGALQALS